MDIIFLIGRILFGALFLGSAMGHLTQTAAMAGYAASRGVPMAALATRATGVQIAVGGAMVILGVWGDLGAILLVAFLVATAFLMHPFWKESEAATKQMEMIQFNKDIALAGGALAFLWAFSQDVGLTLTGPLLF
ncbi:MAG: DoxX family protein [Propionibacteriales bacterium]|nr:DoxX family protein [Propionibacteriales bacterium]